MHKQQNRDMEQWKDSTLYPPMVGQSVILASTSGKMCFAIYRETQTGVGYYIHYTYGSHYLSIGLPRTYWMPVPEFDLEAVMQLNDPEGYKEMTLKIEKLLQQ